MRGSSRGAAVLGLAALAACGRGRPPEAQAPAEPARRAVRTAVVLRQAEGAETAVPGVVAARQRAVLASRAQAAVVALPFREGERVAAGSVVARLDDAAAQAAVAAALSAEQAATADLRRAEVLQSRGAATPRELDEAAARAAAARAGVQAARESLSYAVLRAPFAGAVAARPAHVGDVVAPGAPVIEIEGGGGFEVVATVEAAHANRIRPGLALRAEIDGSAEPLAAVVRAVSPAGDLTTHRFEVRADLPDAPGLRSGAFARLLVPLPGSEPRLLVPPSALVRRGGLLGLFVVEGGRARLRWIALGESDSAGAEVRAGVDAGETVVLEPGDLSDGTPVRAEG
jgi:membrane fusion protein, multidrug efflux system